MKPTNPAAQKAALSQSTQYKVSPRPTAKIKPRPIHSIASGKVSDAPIATGCKFNVGLDRKQGWYDLNHGNKISKSFFVFFLN